MVIRDEWPVSFDYVIVIHSIHCRGVTREGHEGHAHPPKNFDFGFYSERGEIIASQRRFPDFC